MLGCDDIAGTIRAEMSSVASLCELGQGNKSIVDIGVNECGCKYECIGSACDGEGI